MERIGATSAIPMDAAADGAEAAASPRSERSVRPTTRRRMVSEWQMYVLILPGLLYFVVFRYVPLLGNVVAFQDYSPFLGFLHSPWVGWDNFTRLLDNPLALHALKNTLLLNAVQIVFAFPAPIALALLLNSLISERVKRLVQSVVYLPHFLSWVIVISLWQSILGGDGLVNNVLDGVGLGRVNFMTNPDGFVWLVTAQTIWKEVGWGTIIFLAAITLINPELYEAAAVDGAGGMRRLWHITLPGLLPVISLLLVLRMGQVLSVGFEQFYLQKPAVGQAAEVIDTYVYAFGIKGGQWGVSTVAGLIQGVVGTALVLGANRVAKRLGTEGAF